MEDGHFLSLATVLLGFLLLVFLIVSGFLIYLFATKHDQDKKSE